MIQIELASAVKGMRKMASHRARNHGQRRRIGVTLTFGRLTYQPGTFEYNFFMHGNGRPSLNRWDAIKRILPKAWFGR